MEKIRYQQIYDYEKVHWWYQGRRKLLLKIVNLVLGHKKNQQILDIGCGTGYNMLKLSQFGQVFGIDISPEAIRFCQKRGLKNIHLVKPGELQRR